MRKKTGCTGTLAQSWAHDSQRLKDSEEIGRTSEPGAPFINLTTSGTAMFAVTTPLTDTITSPTKTCKNGARRLRFELSGRVKSLTAPEIPRSGCRHAMGLGIHGPV